MTGIDARDAAAALSEVETIAQKVRRSWVYRIASMMLVLWGALIFAGNMASFAWPAQAGSIWIAVNAIGFAGTFAAGALDGGRIGPRRFDIRIFAAFTLFYGFGALWSVGLGHFGPRQLGVFWPTYFMMIYTIAGLWVGPAFVAIGLGITALTLTGYAYAGAWFDLWMAMVNGGGLMLGGLWMRRT